MSKTERKAASDAARASVELEGFVVPTDTLKDNVFFSHSNTVNKLYCIVNALKINYPIRFFLGNTKNIACRNLSKNYV